MRSQRYKVTIHCNVCGETYFLRGKKSKAGRVETGFKRCLCNNDQDLQVKIEEM
ncbi:hypothetical protein [Rubeoparvulum massiliense]|uniref:hypothetical protein n=1 Tax=Rubeoparvulum massiliense TaxID=1631346 RepID=UPI00164E596F|nr:hypothetical protein [Rubeoparvulum massiliense]